MLKIFPECCGKARFILNGYPDTSATLCYGDLVNYLCDRGYKSSNSTPIVCSSHYEWKYIPLPKCEPDGHCNISDVPVPENGFASCSGSELDKVCYIRCDKGYTYMSDRTVFECGAPTRWGWKVSDKSGKYMRADVGRCEATGDTLANIVMGIIGPKITMASLKSDEKLKQEIISEMKRELKKMNVCTDPCEIKDIQVKRVHGSYLRRAISQSKLFRMIINLYAAVPRGSLITQQSATLALSKNLKHLRTQAAAIKSAIESQTISLQIDGVTVPVKVTCPEGTYHDVDEEKCAACPFGQYQDEAGQLTCKQCPNDTTTDRIGVNNVSKCRNFVCDCLPGYEANVNGTCTDVNECLEDVCPDNARCVNKEGSFRCECLTGFQGGTCFDIDECKRPDACPSAGMQCINTVGSYNCTCKGGLFGDNCDEDCPDKFILIGNTCQHISEGQGNFSEATHACSAIYPDARLVDIKDKLAFKTLTNFLLKDRSYWIGLNDISKEGDFVYSDGSNMGTYNEWGTGNTLPASNDPNKNCVIMDGPSAFIWRVVDCSSKRYIICELQRV
ncbi:uncharacterized protein LOC106168372 [Lingula anatina]|uniref:Uncharacterized protein LOC106168372 n=1 Tax=Lingula anatina TaxID=7574 RepID=A0A2R2MTF2_LINAN|nr:uncharacterized protein LOC106168372 [Lingula anatina]|eukprot:XP_023933541.1 uncharacterized protein LOC106168372 [Lingula anatina]